MTPSVTPVSFGIWKRAFRFHTDHLVEINIVFPFLFVPIIGDHLNAVLIRQLESRGQVSCLSALSEALRESPRLLSMKFHFELPAMLWSFIPVWGWYKDVVYRIRWAMASNVIAFEGYTGSAGRLRCVERCNQLDPKVAVRSMVTVPCILHATILIAMAICHVVFPSSVFFILCLFAMLYIAVPLAGAANTFLYLTIPDVHNADRTAGYLKPSTDFWQFCPRCVNYEHVDGRCTLLSIAVRENHGGFRTECAGLRFSPAATLPRRVACPTCETILELEKMEQEQFQFTCGECSTQTNWQSKQETDKGVA